MQWRSLEWISLLGDSLYYLALLSYASKLDNPSLAIMIVTFSETIPNFFQIMLGVFADSTRYRTKKFFQSGIVRGIIYVCIGLIIFYTNSIYGILLIGVLNSFSDLFGKYVNLCVEPFIKFIVPESKMERALSVNFIVTSSISMFANFLGATLISFTGIYQLAFINAGTFFVVAIGIQLIRPKLEKIEQQIEVEKHDNLRKVFSHIKESLRDLLKMPEMRTLFFIAAGLNSVAITIVPICTIFLAYYASSRVVSISYSIALIQGLIMISGIVGSWLGATVLKNLSTRVILLTSFTGNLLFMLSLFLQQLWVGVFILLFSILVTSVFNLRFSSDIIRSVPAEKMGTIYGCMDTFFLLVPSVISMIFMGLSSIDLKLYLVTVAGFCTVFIILISRIKVLYK